MADENSQAAPFTRPTALSMYPDKSNPNTQPMDQPPQYPTNPQYPPPHPQYPPPQQPYPPPQYQPAPGTAPYFQPQYPAAPGTAPYPQTQYPPAPGMAPYPQPQYFAPPPPQQQSSNVVVIGGQPAPVIYVQRSSTNFTGAIVFSCIVIWCFLGWVCGLIAFILAMVGHSSSSSGDETSARLLLRSSYGLSIVGVVTGIIIFIIIAVELSKIRSTIPDSSSTSCNYGYRYEHSVKTCCPYFDTSILNCGIKGYYYSGSNTFCCPYYDF